MGTAGQARSRFFGHQGTKIKGLSREQGGRVKQEEAEPGSLLSVGPAHTYTHSSVGQPRASSPALRVCDWDSPRVQAPSPAVMGFGKNTASTGHQGAEMNRQPGEAAAFILPPTGGGLGAPCHRLRGNPHSVAPPTRKQRLDAAPHPTPGLQGTQSQAAPPLQTLEPRPIPPDHLPGPTAAP